MLAKKTKQTISEGQTAEEKVSLHPSVGKFRIIGGKCEFCGYSVEDCEVLGKMFKNKQFRCLCGGSDNSSTFAQSIYKYWLSQKVWICNSEGCRGLVESMGGYRDPEILKFYL